MLSGNQIDKVILKAVQQKQYDVLAEYVKMPDAKCAQLTAAGETAMQVAIQNDDFQAIDLLLKCKASLAAENSHSKSPVFWAADHKKWTAVIYIASRVKERFTGLWGDYDYGYALNCCVRDNHLEAAEVLINAGAFLGCAFDQVEKLRDRTAINFAVRNRNLKIVKLLTVSGMTKALLAAEQRLNKKIKNPVELAAELQWWECVEYFANAGKLINQDWLSDALYDAVHRNKNEMAELLLSRGACPNKYHSQNDGNYLLHTAVEHDNPAMAALLFRYGADTGKKIKMIKQPLNWRLKR